MLGYDGKADKWLDVNARYKFGDGKQFVQAGQFKQPNGLEALSAAKHNDFMSQSMVTNTFAVGRRLGVGYSYGHPYDRTSGSADEGAFERHGDWGITASYFGRELTRDFAHGSGYGLRGTWAFFNAGKRILHVGLSYANYDTPSDTLRLRARPNADLTPVRLVDTGSMTDTDRLKTIGAEAFWCTVLSSCRLSTWRRASNGIAWTRGISAAPAATSAACGTSPARVGATKVVNQRRW